MKILELLHNRKTGIRWPEPPRDPAIPTTAVQLTLLNNMVAIDGFMYLDIRCATTLAIVHTREYSDIPHGELIVANGITYISLSRLMYFLDSKITDRPPPAPLDYLQYVEDALRAVRDDPHSRVLRDETRPTKTN